MGSKSDQRRDEVFRRRVRQMLAAGETIAAIQKDTGKSYKHTKRIADQERDELLSALNTKEQGA